MKLVMGVDAETGSIGESHVHFGFSNDERFAELMMTTVPENGIAVEDRGFWGFENLLEMSKSGRLFIVRIKNNYKLEFEEEVELSLLLRYYPSAQKAKPNKNCENIPGSCWVSLRQPNLRVSSSMPNLTKRTSQRSKFKTSLISLTIFRSINRCQKQTPSRLIEGAFMIFLEAI